jgi:peptide-methionine (S)-S-oxide reductase
MKKYFLLLAALNLLVGCKQNSTLSKTTGDKFMELNSNVKLDTATFGSGCFWCTEAIFERLNGVVSVVSGYSGGTIENPTYEEVCNGNTGHTEVCQITFDSSIISFDELLEVFWKTHDPTTLNRQGADIGTQYRSIIFYHNEDQKKLAEHYKDEINKNKTWGKPIVTEISSFTKFYTAEKYHQDYYANNSNQGYCSFVIAPKVEKFEKIFGNKLKK